MAHKAEAYVSLTPLIPPPAAELVSSSRIGRWAAIAAARCVAMLRISAASVAGDSRSVTVPVAPMLYACWVSIARRLPSSCAKLVNHPPVEFGELVSGPASGTAPTAPAQASHSGRYCG